MGYYTRHKLEIVSGNDFTTDYESEITAMTDYSDCFDDEIKWYDHEEVMREFSRKHPKVVFKLIGEGEEKGDLWHEYYLNGSMQRCYGQITFDPFDEDKLN